MTAARSSSASALTRMSVTRTTGRPSGSETVISAESFDLKYSARWAGGRVSTRARAQAGRANRGQQGIVRRVLGGRPWVDGAAGRRAAGGWGGGGGPRACVQQGRAEPAEGAGGGLAEREAELAVGADVVVDRLIQIERTLQPELRLTIGRDRQSKVLLTDHRELDHTPVLRADSARRGSGSQPQRSMRRVQGRVPRRTEASLPSLPLASSKSAAGGAVHPHHASAWPWAAAFCREP